nr:hypothetical protein Iba_chr07dCG0590 [Ipomoea batatas]
MPATYDCRRGQSSFQSFLYRSDHHPVVADGRQLAFAGPRKYCGVAVARMTVANLMAKPGPVGLSSRYPLVLRTWFASCCPASVHNNYECQITLTYLGITNQNPVFRSSLTFFSVQFSVVASLQLAAGHIFHPTQHKLLWLAGWPACRKGENKYISFVALWIRH